MTSTTEIAADVYRISVFVPEINLEFSHFLVRDDEPLLFHAGLRGMSPVLREAVSRLIDVSKIRYVGFSHFESDECGGAEPLARGGRDSPGRFAVWWAPWSASTISPYARRAR